MCVSAISVGSLRGTAKCENASFSASSGSIVRKLDGCERDGGGPPRVPCGLGLCGLLRRYTGRGGRSGSALDWRTRWNSLGARATRSRCCYGCTITGNRSGNADLLCPPFQRSVGDDRVVARYTRLPSSLVLATGDHAPDDTPVSTIDPSVVGDFAACIASPSLPFV